ncbi:unnamed protein product [Ambrosiozyma monospora]|uniref:Unnamed protein product n=1 Tax=Ambrosiozyma monospora TaxID=43982 RepID=A0ACB5SY89_AMBMO|nr:unnamed protein product [Ambrosiozyma monospora]
MLLQFLAYVAPLVGGYLADAKLGKFKAIMIGVWVGLVSHILFVIAGLPPVIKHGKSALAPTVIAIISLAIGTGFIKPNLLPLLLDQYPYRANVLKKLPSGEIVYMDRDKSMESVTMIFYWSINIGAFLQLGTTYAARDIGYWLAFLVPGLMYLLVCLFMLLVGRHISHPPPTGSIIERFLKVLSVCFRGNFLARIKNRQFWEFSYPSNMEARGELYFRKKHQSPITWTEQDVRDYRSTIGQCLMFLYWIVFNLNDTGLSTALNAQAGAMVTKNVPNDLFNNFNQLTIIFLIPVLDFLIYPAIAKAGIIIKPVHKICFGFFLGGLSSMVAAILQWRVYKTSPCGYYATDCEAGVSTVSAWYEVIVYALAAAGECFCYTQAYELAYTRAPDNAKGLVMALFLLMSAFSAAISEAISAVLIDPHLIWPFVGMAAAGGATTIMFLVQYWNLDKIMAKEAAEREHAHQEKQDNGFEEKLSAVVSRASKA